MLASVLISLLAAAHPHLFFDASGVAALRSRAGSTHLEIANHLVQIGTDHLSDPAPTTTDFDDPRYYGQQVAAFAFLWQLTGDARFAAKAEQCLMTYLGWKDWGFGEDAALGSPDLNLGHMLLGVAAAYDWMQAYLPAGEAAAVAARLGTEAQRMAAGMPNAWWVDQYPQNHNWIDTAGLGLAALALQGEDARAAGWLSIAQANLVKLQQALGPISDGSWHEGVPYQAYGLSMALPFWDALARSGVDLTDLGMLRGLGHYRLLTQIPEAARQTFLPYGDFYGWSPDESLEVLRYTAARFRDGEAQLAADRWLAAGPRSHYIFDLWNGLFEFIWYDPTVAPVKAATLPLDTSFSDQQSSVLRSSQAAGDLTVSFKAGPFGGRFSWERVKAGAAPGGHLNWGHDHNDDLSFWVHGNGQWLAPEAEGYDASTGENNGNFAHRTAFHNSLLVDGLGQLGEDRSNDDEQGLPWFFLRDATPMVATAGTAHYAIAGAHGAQLFGASAGVRKWDRLIALSRHRYSLVHDDLQADAPHAFDWICHFQDGASLDTPGWVRGVGKQGQSLGVRVVAPAAWTATTGSQTAQLMDQFDPDGQTAWVRVRPAVAKASVQFLMALLPVATAGWDTQRPLILTLSRSAPGNGAVVAGTLGLPEERWIFPAAAETDAGDLSLWRSAAGVVARQHGRPLRAALFGPGSIADQYGARLLLTSDSAQAIEAAQSGATLTVTGAGIKDFQAFAPGADLVTLNGAAVAVQRSGDLVSWTAAP